MSEFGDIFSDELTTTVFVYGSVAFLAIYAFVAVTWMALRSRERLVSRRDMRPVFVIADPD